MATDYTILKGLAHSYLQTRAQFLVQAAQYPELAGNDSIVGRIGEMIAAQFLQLQGRQVVKHAALNHAVTDLLATMPGGQPRAVSVKLITAENKSGSTTRLKDGWDEFILIELNVAYQVHRLGWLTLDELRSNGQEQLAHDQPITSRRMLTTKGLIGRYGKVYDSQDERESLMLNSLL
ncbi:hypothetical protein [Hymenobacter actinosclerus]|uniref:hypothetical protein n=1 Tax=Hymenobacter actinosclerus TaxID=82805 RepID=UPI000B87ED0D|nr:hypothetical protein [Hymenobacter actinosclerus]